MGTAQLAGDYGITNYRGFSENEESLSLLDHAFSKGINIIDTASRYYNTYKIIEDCRGLTPQNISIVDKVASNVVNDFASSKEFIHWPWLNKFIKEGGSLCLMLHDAREYLDAVVRKNLKNCRDNGLVSSIGISVYEMECLEDCLDIGGFDVLQIPLSLADRRFTNNKIKKKLNNINIHVRSVFLQGLLLSLPKKLPSAFEAYKLCYNKYRLLAPQLEDRLSIAMASAYMDMDCSLVLGIETRAQFDKIYTAYKSIDTISDSLIKDARDIWENLGREITDPRLWKSK